MPQTFGSLVFTLGGQQWELVRYSSGEGRIYHLPDEAIVVDGAHLATPQSLKESLQRSATKPCVARLARSPRGRASRVG